MGFRPSFISLRRLLLGAALVIFGLFLASSTTAQADDLGLSTTLDKVVSSATDVPAVLDPSTTATAVLQPPVEKVVAAVKPATTVATIVQPVEKVVQAPLTLVDPALSQPVKDVVTTTTSIVTKATTTVTKTTATVSRTVEPVVSAGTQVVEPVVAVVDPIVAVPAPLTLPELPDVVAPAQDVAPAVAKPAMGPSVDSAASVDERARAQRDLRVEQALSSTMLERHWVDALQSVFGVETGSVESAVRQAAAAHAPADRPLVPSPERWPAPALPPGGGAAGSGAHGSSSPVGGDLAITPAALTLPASSSAALPSSALHPRPGPVADPGSRPD